MTQSLVVEEYRNADLFCESVSGIEKPPYSCNVSVLGFSSRLQNGLVRW